MVENVKGFHRTHYANVIWFLTKYDIQFDTQPTYKTFNVDYILSVEFLVSFYNQIFILKTYNDFLLMRGAYLSGIESERFKNSTKENPSDADHLEVAIDEPPHPNSSLLRLVEEAAAHLESEIEDR